MIGKILFSLVLFVLFAYVFIFKLIKKNDTTYLYVLIGQAVGILLNFIQIIFSVLNGVFLTCIISILCIIIFLSVLKIPICRWFIKRKVGRSKIYSINIWILFKQESLNASAVYSSITLLLRFNWSASFSKKSIKKSTLDFHISPAVFVHVFSLLSSRSLEIRFSAYSSCSSYGFSRNAFLYSASWRR